MLQQFYPHFASQNYGFTVNVLKHLEVVCKPYEIAVDSPTNYYTPMNGLFSGRSTIDTKLLSIKYGLCNFYVTANSYRTPNSESARWLSGYIYIYINQSIHLLGGSMSYNYPPVIKYGHTRKLPIQFDEFPLKAFMWGDFPNHIYRGYIPTYSQFVDTFWGV